MTANNPKPKLRTKIFHLKTKSMTEIQHPNQKQLNINNVILANRCNHETRTSANPLFAWARWWLGVDPCSYFWIGIIPRPSPSLLPPAGNFIVTDGLSRCPPPPYFLELYRKPSLGSGVERPQSHRWHLPPSTQLMPFPEQDREKIEYSTVTSFLEITPGLIHLKVWPSGMFIRREPFSPPRAKGNVELSRILCDENMFLYTL
ncbi:hypothetical protein J6590_017174 [Homalodisca vitripennis]|nr:hypothetical protein J6590_017174 [Homalodisca vitripennis]